MIPAQVIAKAPQNSADWAIFAAIVAVVLAAIGLSALWNRARRRKLVAAAENLGLAAVEKGDAEAEYRHQPAKGQHSFDLKLCAVGLLDGRAARVAEFTYVTGRGKGRRTWTNLQASLECPSEWPALALDEARGFFRRPITELFKEPEPPISDEAFNKRWQVVCDDRGFAAGLLTPQIREFLLRAPSCERWLLGEGWATCTWRKICGEKDLAPLLERAKGFLAAADAYTAAPAGAAIPSRRASFPSPPPFAG